MVEVSKDEIGYLMEKGCKFGDELHRTYTRHKKYCASETRKVLKLLEEYRSAGKIIDYTNNYMKRGMSNGKTE